jgi:peptidoglycan hydrolase-like protein with peptidoglycan-binding domain
MPSFDEVGQVGTLAVGSHGPDVVRAKTLLKALGYIVTDSDVFDEGMRAAVADFQPRYMRMTGREVETNAKIGPSTGFAMANALESMRESPMCWLEFSQRVESQVAQPAPSTPAPAPPPTQPPRVPPTSPAPSEPQAPTEPQVPYLGAPVLTAGSTDKAQIFVVQQQLVTLGYGLTPDGDFGETTRAALADLQRLYTLLTGQPLVADGACNDATRRVLAEAIRSGLLQRLPEPLRHGTISVGYQRGAPYIIVTRQLGDGQGGALETRAALAYYAMHAAAVRAGAHFAANESFRTYEQQTNLWRRYHRREPGHAARPGWSTHQSGIAIDASRDDDAGSQWLVRHAREYGFILPGYLYSAAGRTEVEDWHWEYRVDRLTNQARAFYGLPKLPEDPRPMAAMRAQRAPPRRAHRR